jgi:integrase
VTRERRGFGHIRKCQPSERYQASYTGPDGRRYRAPKTFAARIDAEGWLTDRRREIDRELWSPPATEPQKLAKRAAEVKFGDYAKNWLATRLVKGQPLAARTREDYGRLLEKHIYPTFKNRAVRDIEMAAVDRWYAKTAPGAPTERAHAYSLLRSILETACKRDRLVIANPCQIEGAGSVKRKSKTKLATLEQLATITTEMPEHLRPMIPLGAWGALRYGELVELRRKDIYLTEDDGVVHVRRGAVRVKGGWEIGGPKTQAGIRDVNIPPHILPVIKAHLSSKHVGAGAEALLFPPTSDDPAKRLQPSTFNRHYYKARAKAKRTDLRFHDLRHTGATLAAQTGATLAELMARIGHSTPAAAMRYQHAAEGRDKQIAAALSKLAEAGPDAPVV